MATFAHSPHSKGAANGAPPLRSNPAAHDPFVARSPQEERARPIQRKCAACAEEEEQAPPIQRKCAEEERAPPVQRKCAACAEEERAPAVQRKASSYFEPTVASQGRPWRRAPQADSDAPEVGVLRKSDSDGSPRTADIGLGTGGGASIPRPLLRRFESRFGARFDDVRIHTDGAADSAARDLSAHAFTTGSDVYFAAGQYAPSTPAGDRLLAHELTHVLQQRAGVVARQPRWSVSSPRDPLEREADAVAEAVTSDRPSAHLPTPSATTAPTIQREDHGGAAAPQTQTSGGEAAPVARVRPSGEFFYYRGVAVSAERTFMRSQLWDLIGASGLEGTREWLALLIVTQGRPGVPGAIPLPFSAHTRAFGGLRPRSALDVIQEDRQEALRAAVAPTAIPIVVEVFTEVEARATTFLATYEATARLTVSAALARSRERVLAEQARYGIREVRAPETVVVTDIYGMGAGTVPGEYAMDTNAGTRGMAGAARALAAPLRNIMRLRGDMARVAASHTTGPGDGITDIGAAISDPELQRLAEQKRTAAHDYQILRQEKTAAYPILASFAPDPEDFTVFAVRRLEQLATGSSASVAATLHEDIADKLSKIQQTYANLRTGDLKIWSLPNIVQITNNQIEADRTQRRLVADKVAAERAAAAAVTTALSILAIGLGLLAAIPTGGASLGVAALSTAAAVGGAAASTALAVRHIREYAIQSAASGTDFEKAQAISSEEPSLFWLALDLIGAGLDIYGAATAFRALRSAVSEAIRLRRAADPAAEAAMRRAAELADAQRPGSGVGRRISDDIVSRARRGAAEPEQVAHWEASVNQETRGFLVDHPDVRATYLELDPLVRQLLTHCSALCIIANASRRDAARLRAILDRLQLTSEELGYLREYFHVRRGNLGAALTELERAQNLDELRGFLLRALERAENTLPNLPAGATATTLRNTQGVATGGVRLPRIASPTEWLPASGGQAALIPRQVANQLRGQTFANFGALREEIWRLIAADDRLAAAFGPANRTRMQAGLAPIAPGAQHTGTQFNQMSYNIHHIDPIEAGGGVYDLDNLIITSPAYHDLVHY